MLWCGDYRRFSIKSYETCLGRPYIYRQHIISQLLSLKAAGYTPFNFKGLINKSTWRRLDTPADQRSRQFDRYIYQVGSSI